MQMQMSRPMPHCRVLPPGEFISKIPEPLPICSDSLTTTALTVFANNAAEHGYKHCNLVTNSVTNNSLLGGGQDNRRANRTPK